VADVTSTPPTIIHGARLVAAGETVRDAWVRFEGGRVAARGDGDGWRAQVARDASVMDASGLTLVPGFIDLHCHGAGGASVDDGEAAIETTIAVHGAHGTTRTVCSLVSAPVRELVPRLESIARVAAREPRVLGAHLEGPFLDDGFRGAHDPAALRAPDATAVDALLEASAGQLRQVTLAPEHDAGFAALRRFTGAGVAVAVGHTSADFRTALDAFEAGASILTHAFNAMHGIHHRAPGPVVAAMHAQHVTLELIADGVHVHPDVVRLAFEGARGRVALITDAMAAAGAADGTYDLGSLRVDVRDGTARLAGADTIAGSTLTQDVALRRAVTDSGIALEDAVAALTSVPAAAVGRAHDLGRLEPGYAADAVLLTEQLAVAGVWASGAQIA
jgi:N-acetylglucosamine-6-phosphate deacetylase